MYNSSYFPEPVEPLINRPDTPRNIPVGDGSPESLTVGENITALDTTPLRIWCPARGVPKPDITWTKDGQPLPITMGVNVDNDGTLTIGYVQVSQSGRYVCTATNIKGEDSVATYVKVVGKFRSV